MKKFLCLLFICLSVLCLSSCELLAIILGGLTMDSCTEYTEVNLDDNRDYYLLQFNWTDDSLIPASYTAYVDYDNSRSAEGEEVSDVPKPEGGEIEKYSYAYTDQKVRDEIIKISDNSRSAVSKGSYATGINTNTYSLYDKKTFYVFGKNDQVVEKQATCVGYNNKCNIWCINNNPDVVELDSTQFKAIGDKFADLCDIEEKILGAHTYSSTKYKYYISSQDKIDIVIYDIFEDATSTQNGGTFGYFRPYDMYKNGQKIEGYDIDTSNQTQAIFIDSYFLNLAPNMVYSTLCHEYCHLLNYVQKSVKQGVAYSTWFTEMLAMVSEDMMRDVIGVNEYDSPVARLNSENYGFTDYYNYGPTAWYQDEAVYVSYANSFALGAFLVRQFGGFDLLTEMAKNAYGDKEAVVEALKSKGYNMSFADIIASEYSILMDKALMVSNIVYSGNSNVKFQPIDISYRWCYDKTTKSYKKKLNVYPDIYTANSSYRKDIGPNGFLISEISEDNSWDTIGIRYANISDIWNMYIMYKKSNEWVFINPLD